MTVQRIGYRSGRWICIKEMTTEIRRSLPVRGSLMYLDKDAYKVEDEGLYWNEWIRVQVARSHQLIDFLLDRSCSATDVIPSLPNVLWLWGSQVQDSVLALAVSRAKGLLIQRPIDSGADISSIMPGYRSSPGPQKGHTHDVTTLHLASLFY